MSLAAAAKQLLWVISSAIAGVVTAAVATSSSVSQHWAFGMKRSLSHALYPEDQPSAVTQWWLYGVYTIAVKYLYTIIESHIMLIICRDLKSEADLYQPLLYTTVPLQSPLSQAAKVRDIVSRHRPASSGSSGYSSTSTSLLYVSGYCTIVVPTHRLLLSLTLLPRPRLNH